MLLAHRIRLDPAPVQRDYFARAAGTARRVWNWALAEWQRQAAAGQRPNAMVLKKQCNAMKYAHPDWLDAEGQPWLRAIHRDAHSQPFANLAKAWRRYFAALCEHKPAHRPVFKKKGHCRDSFYVANDKLRLEGKTVVLPKVGPVTLRERKDFMHKLTARLCRENQTVVIADLNVRGMLANARLSRAIADVGFYEFRRQLQYKAGRYGTTLILADRWYPSSKLCSRCGTRHGELTLGERGWTCSCCGAGHDRDVNAAINLKRLATGACAAQSALPVASLAATPGTAAGIGSAGDGKVTPARHEHGRPDGSGQEQNDAHFRAHF
jgi:IS605 OrfB family transposase